MRRWAFMVCMACILSGGLELLLPKKGSWKSIKTVVALYILLSVISPAVHEDLFWYPVVSELSPVDYSFFVREKSENQLTETLKDSLYRNGISGELTVQCKDGVWTVLCTADDPETAKEILRAELGSDVMLSVSREGAGT